MKLISWNVNGLRACMKKGFRTFFDDAGADIFCLQETKMQQGQAEVDLPGYLQYWNSAARKGYSGTAVFTRRQPLSAAYGFGGEKFGGEGRVITLEYPEFFLVNVYTPNSKDGLARLPYRMEWDDAFRAYLRSLDASKPVVVCGDMNVAHEEIDLKNPAPNRGHAGFSDEERQKMTALLASGFTDSFRLLHPGETGAYTWWSYRFHARRTNAGWRIDYFLVSDRLKSRIKESGIRAEVMGSDHCPVELVLNSDGTA